MNGPIIFGEPHFDDTEEERVLAVLRSRWIGQGPVVAEFEQAFARYVGAPTSVAVSSCTAALQLALLSANIGPGDEVITTSFTFVATINAIDQAGATPVVVDIDRDTLAITPEAVAAAVTPRTRAIMPVHFGGLPVDVEGFDALATAHDLWLVEDAAHAAGAVAAGRRVGAPRHDQHMACFSFYPNKNLASAEGGALTGGDPAVLERAGRLRLHGLDNDAWKRFAASSTPEVSMAVEAGLKANWTDLQAAIGVAQLAKLEGFLAIREALALMYADALAAAAPARRGAAPAPAARPADSSRPSPAPGGGRGRS